MASLSGSPPRSRPESPESGEGGRRQGLTAASLFLVLILFWIVTRIEYVIILGLFGLLLGTVLEGPVFRLQQRHIPRPAAIFLVYVAIIGALVLMVVLIIPPIADQAESFRDDIPTQLENLEEDWRASSNPILRDNGAPLIQQAIDWFDEPSGDVEVSTDTVQNAIPLISSITGGIIAVVTTLVVTFYYLMEKAFIRKVVIGQLDPVHQVRVDRIWKDVEDKVGGWMRGQLLLCLIIGSIATVSYGILDIRFWPLLGLWAGLTEIIPIVGPWIGGVPAVIVALTMGWDKALLVGGVIIGMQTLENWFLVPRVMRGAVGLTPLSVFIAILAGTQFMGVTGAILAIPIAAAVQVILADYFATRQLKREPQAQSGWRWMLSRAGRDGDGVGFGFDDDVDERRVQRRVAESEQTISRDVVPGQAEPSAPAAAPPPSAPLPATEAREPEGHRAAPSRSWTPFGPGEQDGQHTPQVEGEKDTRDL